MGDIMETEDGSDISVPCFDAYVQELGKQALIQAQTIQNMIHRGEMCASNDTITELAPSASMANLGSQVNR
jgi:hypothetical protein